MADKPEFDFTKGYSHKEAIENDLQVKRLRFLDARLAKGDGYASLEAFEDELTKYRELMAVLDGFITRVLVSVPREWLMPDSPEVIDWTDPDSMEFVRQDKYLSLMEAAAEAKSPESVTKN